VKYEKAAGDEPAASCLGDDEELTSDAHMLEVALSGPLRRTFVYAAEAEQLPLAPGQRVLVPFGRQRRVGYVAGPGSLPEGVAAKSIASVIDRESLFSSELFELCVWIADYYFANLADVLSIALPSSLRGRKLLRYQWNEIPSGLREQLPNSAKPGKLISIASERELRRDRKLWSGLQAEEIVTEVWPTEESRTKQQLIGYMAVPDLWQPHFERRRFKPDMFEGTASRQKLIDAGWTTYQTREAVKAGVLRPIMSEDPVSVEAYIPARPEVKEIQLNNEQSKAVDSVNSRLDGGFSPFLLHGVTGSGKTLVYCHIIERILAAGKTALLLTPEIALSGQVLAYCRGFFGDQVTVMHSAMSEKERLESFAGIRSGRYRVVIGPRSALFAPLANLGLIVVDEEHDSSYKQDDPSPRFHGRDAAIMRARLNRIPILLGTATPSLESYNNVKQGRYDLVELKMRPSGATLPTVNVVDMRRQQIRGEHHLLSYPLKKEAEDRIARGEQVILFLNRRGHSPQTMCGDCGQAVACPNCRVNLTYHRAGQHLSCHYCGYNCALPEVCPSCGSSNLSRVGTGTQRIEDNLPSILEKARILRMDSDSASGRGRPFELLSKFASEDYNILLGTQMVTKGLDFPRVTLVGILAADASLDLPDFRASEKAFARLLQVAGRSGRGERVGDVLIQTYYPESPLIDDAARQDYNSFFEREIESRENLNYPPFSRLSNIVLSGPKEEQVEVASQSFRKRLSQYLESYQKEVQILGPAPCALYYLRGRYRRHVLIKTSQKIRLSRLLTEWELQEPRFGLPAAIRIGVDIDADDML